MIPHDKKNILTAVLTFCMLLGGSLTAFAGTSAQEIEVFAYADEDSYPAVYVGQSSVWQVDSANGLACKCWSYGNYQYTTIAGRTSNGYWVTPVWSGTDYDGHFEYYLLDEEGNNETRSFLQRSSAAVSADGRYFNISCTFKNLSEKELTVYPQVVCDTCIDGDDAACSYSNEDHTCCTMTGYQYRTEYNKSVSTSFLISGESDGFRVKGIENCEYGWHSTPYDDYTEVSEPGDSAFIGRWDTVTVAPGESFTVTFQCGLAETGK